MSISITTEQSRMANDLRVYHMVEKITGENLDQYVSKNIWNVLDMSSTSFNPSQDYSIAPT